MHQVFMTIIPISIKTQFKMLLSCISHRDHLPSRNRVIHSIVRPIQVLILHQVHYQGQQIPDGLLWCEESLMGQVK
jgi:hypothetical protein